MAQRPTMRSFMAATPGFRSGNDTPRDFLERCLVEISAREPEIGAFVHLDIAGAQAAADRSTGRWRDGKMLSPIDGMPVGIKDIIETRDMPTQMGSRLYEGYRSGRDGASVAALREAGAVILGKTVTTEFAAAWPGNTRNPWDLSRTPGGSSSGSAAAVGSGMLPAALGTQVVGSIVRPASFCGCVGFKPTYGAINRGGSHDAFSHSTHGALAASLDDAWQVVRAISDRAGGDPGSPGLFGPATTPAPTRPDALIFLETAGWAEASPAAKAQFEAARAKLEAAGVKIVTRAHKTVEAAESALVDAIPVTRRINAWEGRWPLNDYRHRDVSKLSEPARERLVEAEAMTLGDYRTVLAERVRMRDAYAALASVGQACITLTATDPAPVGLASTGNPIFACPGSILGVPAISLPVLSVDGLPLGFQVMGYEHGDATAIGIAGWVAATLSP